MCGCATYAMINAQPAVPGTNLRRQRSWPEGAGCRSLQPPSERKPLFRGEPHRPLHTVCAGYVACPGRWPCRCPGGVPPYQAHVLMLCDFAKIGPRSNARRLGYAAFPCPTL